jgi:hypothetical protein
MTADEYLREIGDLERQSRAASLLQLVNAFTAEIHAGHKLEGEPPALQIVRDDIPNAGSIGGVIQLTTGMVDHCLDVQVPNLLLGSDEGGAKSLIHYQELAIRHIMVAWIVGHEYVHQLHHHDRAMELFGRSATTEMAVEHDADLSSTAFVYRHLQARLAHLQLHDLTLKALVLFAIFWLLRTLTTFCKRSTHSPVSHRLYHIVLKLAVLPAIGSNTRLPDLEFRLPETREANNVLIERLKDLERDFQELPNYSSAYGNLQLQIYEALTSGEMNDVISEWDRIRVGVAELRKDDAYTALEMQATAYMRAMPASRD